MNNKNVKSIEESCKALLAEIDLKKIDPELHLGRPQLISAMLLWSSIFASIIGGSKWLKDIWRKISSRRIWGNKGVSVKDEAVYKRMKGDAWKKAQNIFYAISEKISAKTAEIGKELAPFAKAIYAMDGSVLDKLAKKTAWLKGKEGCYLGGKIASVYDVRRGQFVTVEITEDANENDKKSAWGLLEKIEEGTLLLADLGYFGFHWFDELTGRGIYFVSRMREKTSYKRVHLYYENNNVTDSIIFLGKYRSDRAKYAVRLIEVRYKGNIYRYITNVLDPMQLKVRDIVELYGRRWDIELAFKFVKGVLGLSAIWSARPEIIKLQVYATLTISQIIKGMCNELAIRAHVSLDNVSEKLFVRMIYITMSNGDSNFIENILEMPEYGGVIRPPRRKKYDIPDILENLIRPLPTDMILTQQLRYGEKKCIHRAV